MPWDVSIGTDPVAIATTTATTAATAKAIATATVSQLPGMTICKGISTPPQRKFKKTKYPTPSRLLGAIHGQTQ